MSERNIHSVTGAFGFTGKYITKKLLAFGEKVQTLTNSVNRFNPFGDRVTIASFNFDKPELLAESLKNTKVLYNTYWVRFNHKLFKHSEAVHNTLVLFEAAKKAGVERIVHVSITNPSEESPLEYFHGKAVLEKALINSGLSYSILRPAVIFGTEDILVNNIAWMLRRLPVFGVFSDGKYRLQPIFVEDMADLAIQEGKTRENRIVDATGPETFTYADLARTIGTIIGKRRKIISVPDWLGYFVASIVGKIKGDITLTREEIKGLKSDLLATSSPPAGKTKLTEWVKANKDTLGVHYANEIARRKNRELGYDKL